MLDELHKEYQELIELGQEVLRHPSFKDWLADAEHLPDNFLDPMDKYGYSYTMGKTFQDVESSLSYDVMSTVRTIVKAQKQLWRRVDDLDKYCQYYEEYRKKDLIKNPELIQFLDDYKKWKEISHEGDH